MEKLPDSYSNIPAAFLAIAENQPDRVVYRQALIGAAEESQSRRAQCVRSYTEVRERVLRLANVLAENGVSKGSKVAILSSSRPEWMEADLAILACGGVAVSVYQSLPAEDVGYILFDSGADIVFAENQEQLDKLVWLSQNEIDIDPTEERAATRARLTLKRVITFEQTEPHALALSLDSALQSGVAQIPEAVHSLTQSDLAALVYTSGTTGPPKGVMQSHGNHLANVRQVLRAGLIEHGSTIMIFLPLAHSFAKLMGYLTFLTGAKAYFPAIPDPRSSKLDPASVTRDISEMSASVVPLVPRMLEKMRDGILQKARATGLAGKLLAAAVNSALAVYRYQSGARGKPPSLWQQIVYQGTAPLREKIRTKLFGPDYLFAVSGGAKLPVDVAHFFEALGILVLEGYGLTETCVATNVNLQHKRKIGTVGPCLDDDIQICVAEDGEILFRGPNIALGYYGRKAATESVWDAKGWFHTGDLGALDQDGFLSIVGRKKEILVTSGGKNIAPTEIEDALKASPYVSQAVLIGDGAAFCVALVSLQEDALLSWAKDNRVQLTEPLARDTQVFELISAHIAEVNRDLASYETVKRIGIVPEDFTVENGFLTPTFKVKRKLVTEHYAELIEQVYRAARERHVR